MCAPFGSIMCNISSPLTNPNHIILLIFNVRFIAHQIPNYFRYKQE